MTVKLSTKPALEINHIETGKRVRSAREKADMSLRRLASEIGISAPFLSDLELGRRNWKQPMLDKVNKILSNI